MALLTKPKDLDYEIFIFKKYEGLMKHILASREKRSGATLEEDLHILKTKTCEEVGYMNWMAIVYRSEKKKIVKSNIDLCQFVIKLLLELVGRRDSGTAITLADYHKLTMEETAAEKRHFIKEWVHNPDTLFSEDDQFIRRRIQMRTYTTHL